MPITIIVRMRENKNSRNFRKKLPRDIGMFKKVIAIADLPKNKSILPVRSFQEVVAAYDVVFFDVDGVLRLGQDLLPNVLPALSWLRNEQKHFWLVTNSYGLLPDVLAEQFNHTEWGELVNEEQVISSGVVLSDFLKTHYPLKKVAYLGRKVTSFYIEQAGNPAVSLREPFDVFVLTWVEDIPVTKAELTWVKQFLWTHPEVPMILPNPDYYVPLPGKQFRYGPGKMAKEFQQAIGRSFIGLGKPYSPIFDYAMLKVRSTVGKIPREKILMIGDTLVTDILGAERAGLPSALVLSGNISPDRYQHEIAVLDIMPTHVISAVEM